VGAYPNVMRSIYGVIATFLAVGTLAGVATAQPSTKPVGQNYAGEVTACSESGVSRYRFAFVAGGKTVETVMVDPGKTQKNIRVKKGSYQVQVAKLAGNKYSDVAAISLSVSADGWKVAPSCTASKPKPKKPKKKTKKKTGSKRPKLRLPKQRRR